MPTNYNGLVVVSEAFLKLVGDNLDDKAKKTLGNKALTLISDYPLYASSSNITYEEAISVALILFGDINKAYKEQYD